MKNNKKPVNYGKIKRDMFKEDMNFDSRFTTKVQVMQKHKKPKHKNNYFNEDE